MGKHLLLLDCVGRVGRDYPPTDVGKSPTPASTSPANHIKKTTPGTASTIEVIDPPPDLHIPSIHATTLGTGQSRDGNIDQVSTPPSNTVVELWAPGHGERGEILQVPGGTNIFAADVHQFPNTTTSSRSPRAGGRPLDNNAATRRRRPRPRPRATDSLQDAVVNHSAVPSQSQVLGSFTGNDQQPEELTGNTVQDAAVNYPAVPSQSQMLGSPPVNAPQLVEIAGDAVQDIAVNHTTIPPQPQTLASPPRSALQREEITRDADDEDVVSTKPERSGYGQRVRR